MDFIRNFFVINHDIIYFIYGLTFFMLGLAVALQSRHTSRLDLARSLKWLAAFGFLHGFHEWGDLFIPLQAENLAPNFVLVLHYIHLMLLAVSFTCLFEFGVALLEPLKYREWLHIGAAGLLAAWFFVVSFPLRVWLPGFNEWHNTASALARYFIGLPGGLLAAYALRAHTLQRIAPLKVPHIFKALQISGITMFFYGLAAGLIVPPINFFPGNWLNTDTFTNWFLVPPQIVRALIGLAMTMTTIRALEIFDVETSRQIEAMEQQQILASERERIARDLHDGTIQKVYTAGLLVRSAQNLTKPDTPMAGRLATAVGVLDDAIGDLRQNLNELHAPVNPQEPFALALQKLAADPRFGLLVDVALDMDLSDSITLDPERAAHVLVIVQETLANVVRHAHARHVKITAHHLDDQLQLTIRDDGIGTPSDIVEGHGLRNMRERASLLHGELDMKDMKKGTRVTLTIPWKVEK